MAMAMAVRGKSNLRGKLATFPELATPSVEVVEMMEVLSVMLMLLLVVMGGARGGQHLLVGPLMGARTQMQRSA